MYSYANSSNRLTEEKISPASFSTDERGALLQLAGRNFRIEYDIFSPESKFYFVSYIFMPVEMRGEVLLLSTESPWEHEFWF